jgi:hypothetical protein
MAPEAKRQRIPILREHVEVQVIPSYGWHHHQYEE